MSSESLIFFLTHNKRELEERMATDSVGVQAIVYLDEGAFYENKKRAGQLDWFAGHANQSGSPRPEQPVYAYDIGWMNKPGKAEFKFMKIAMKIIDDIRGYQSSGRYPSLKSVLDIGSVGANLSWSCWVASLFRPKAYGKEWRPEPLIENGWYEAKSENVVKSSIRFLDYLIEKTKELEAQKGTHHASFI